MERVLDINRSFKAMRLVSVISFLGFIAATCWYVWMYTTTLNKQRDEIYVVTDRGTYTASAKSEREVSVYEADLFAELFIQNMFAHDADTYENRMENALNMCDKKTGTYLAESFEKGKVKDNYKKWGSRTEVEIDSIKILSTGVPMKVAAFFRQNHLIGAEQKAYLNMACKFDLIKTKRHKQNRMGLQVANFDFFEYQSAANQ